MCFLGGLNTVLGQVFLMVFLWCTLLPVEPAMAFKEWVHDSITKEAMDNFTVKTPDGSELIFSIRAIKEVQHANRSVDYRNPRDGFRGELLNPAAHCDDETLDECSEHIEYIVDDLVTDAGSAAGKKLRILLGRAMHTLHDFYSHSNWVDERGLNKTTPNTDLGKGPLESPVKPAQPGETTCQPTEWDLYDGVGTVKITSGYFPLQFRKGWFPLAAQWLNIWSPPSNKCAHGYSASPDYTPPFALSVGINKDFEGRPYFGQARSVAVAATKQYLTDVVNALHSRYGGYKEIRKLLNVNGTLGFVIDDTGSMSPTLAGVKNSVTRIVNRVKDLLEASPDEYMLVRFGDDVGEPIIAYDAEELLAAVNALSAHAGGDCPESSNAAMLRAINAAQFGSRLHLFTDASVKDPQFSQNVVAAAESKEVTLKYVVTGNCLSGSSSSLTTTQAPSRSLFASDVVRMAASVDPVYEDIARQTGAQLIVLDNTEAAVSSYYSIIEPELTGDLEQMLIAEDELASDSESFSLPVDSTMTGFAVSVNMTPKGTIKLYRPTGSEVVSGDTDATITDMPGGLYIFMDSPAPGSWILTLSGNAGDAYTLRMTGNTTLRIERFEFVEMKGQLFHEALYALDGQPVLGTAVTALANLSGALNTTRFVLADAAGYILKDIVLSQGNSYAAPEDFVGDIELPSESFRLYVMGTDSAGYNYLRAFPSMFTGQTVEVKPMLYESEFTMTAGEMSSVSFEVTNRGLDNNFNISATDDHGFVKSVSDTSITLASGASAQVDVQVEPPVDMPADTNVVLTLVATGTNGTSTENSAAFGWRVLAAEPPVTPTDTPSGGGGGGGGGGCFVKCCRW